MLVYCGPSGTETFFFLQSFLLILLTQRRRHITLAIRTVVK